MGVAFVASARGAYSSGAKTLTLTYPPGITNGDVMVALVARNASDARGATPVGWTFVSTVGTGADTLDTYTRTRDGTEPATVVFLLPTVTGEWQGELIAWRGGAAGSLFEATNSIGFATTTSLTTAGVTSLQAASVIMVLWTCSGSGSPTLTLPAGFTSIDNFNTAVVSSRSALLGYKVAGATGALTFSAATASVNTTGRSNIAVLRDRLPVTPDALADLVPGNIGLIGKDTRPAR